MERRRLPLPAPVCHAARILFSGGRHRGSGEVGLGEAARPSSVGWGGSTGRAAERGGAFRQAVSASLWRRHAKLPVALLHLSGVGMTTMTVVKRDDGKLGGFGRLDERAYSRFKKMIEELGEGEFFTISFWFPRNSSFHR